MNITTKNAECLVGPRAAFTRDRKILLLCQTSVFLSGFLLFLIEPIIAKIILPWFGGSAAVWVTCLVFFQSALLLGYYYADLTNRVFAPEWQTVTHIGVQHKAGGQG